MKDFSLILVVAISILQVLDALTTYAAINRRGAREVNAVMAGLFNRIGVLPALLLTKAGVVALLFAGYYFDIYQTRLDLVLLALLMMFYTAVVMHNTLQIQKH